MTVRVENFIGVWYNYEKGWRLSYAKKGISFSAGVYIKSKMLSINDLSGVKYDILAMGKKLKMQIRLNIFQL